ncbi:hypothetical protein [Halococcoides cellulosivorans]|uniref:hypothetical protein n=1 Tax=Halococcoides cellulosivorans TaxID=1679096 RepID=UPI00131F1B47|nr:hypothetical protein [Halococcoides cellulosivorans]
MQVDSLAVGTLLITLGAVGSVARAVEAVGPVTLAVGTAALTVGILLVALSDRGAQSV